MTNVVLKGGQTVRVTEAAVVSVSLKRRGRAERALGLESFAADVELRPDPLVVEGSDALLERCGGSKQ